MPKAVVILLIVLSACPAALGASSLRIVGGTPDGLWPQASPTEWYFAVVYQGDTLTDIGGIGLSAVLTGAGASHLTAMAGLNRYNAATGSALASRVGGTFAWASSGELSVAYVDSGRLGWNWGDTPIMTVTDGQVVAVLRYALVGGPATGPVTVTLLNDIYTGSPCLVNSNYEPLPIAVSNNGASLPVPEPATMGLLGLGLVGLALRRPK